MLFLIIRIFQVSGSSIFILFLMIISISIILWLESKLVEAEIILWLNVGLLYIVVHVLFIFFD